MEISATKNESGRANLASSLGGPRYMRNLLSARHSCSRCARRPCSNSREKRKTKGERGERSGEGRERGSFGRARLVEAKAKMAMKQMERGGNLDVFGTREYGQDVRTQNITAVSAVANIIKSSLGPVGLDKVRAALSSRSPCGARERL